MGALRGLVAAAAFILAVLPARAADVPGEYEVKAAYLYNFAKFVEWPAEAPATPPGTFVVTVVGADPFGRVLEETLKGKAVGGARLVLRRARDASDVPPSHIVFVSESEHDRLGGVLDRLAGSATLTVGETEDFAEKGGVIRFRMEDDRVRLDINPESARRARLRISSDLLRLARIVRPAKGS